ncbi:hypothetical protein AZE42_02575 [Rhizopogon vesiculosus]|uniref:Uncharacterized protein n=1 Tax=Rhizopogon vesiculosus TaxID=180088 RepID=A0A1J8PIP7_9AGAM|nr:hypothetical protein AZE42_02575 [Rhizopogon vesiculosus]
MLKRQRPPTPPPSLDETPSLTLFPNRPIRPLPHCEAHPELFSRECRAKKRRIHPPVLDGAQRGWAKPLDSSMPLTNDSDGEEDWIDGEDDAAAAYAYPRGATSPDHTDYKRTNSMLHEVHTLHQHRLIFSQPSSEPSSHLGFSAPSLSTATFLPLQSSHGLYSPSSFSCDGKMSIPECPVPGHYSHLAHVAPALNNSAAYTPLDFHEVKSVRERTSKIVGIIIPFEKTRTPGG